MAGPSSSSYSNAAQIPPHRTLPQAVNTASASPVSRSLELKLMHHYTNHTCKTFTFTAPHTEHIWRVVVPELAFGGASHLTEAILAVAALHLRSKHPDNQQLVQASHHYINTTLQEYSAALGRGIDASNAEALFFTSTFIAFQTTATRTFTKDEASLGGGLNGFDHAPTQGAYSVPLSLFSSFQGIKTVTAMAWPFIRNSPVVNEVINSQQALQLDFGVNGGFFDRLLVGLDEELSNMEARVKPYPSSPIQGRGNTYTSPQGINPLSIPGFGSEPMSPYNYQQLSTSPQHLPVPPQSVNSNPGASPVPGTLNVQQQQLPPHADITTTRQAYQHAVAVLNWAHKIPHRGAALAFPATVSSRFVELLNERQPRAMAILASYFALLRSLDGVWWLQGMARREVLGVVSLFNNDYFGPEANRRWMPELKWALDMALYEEKDGHNSGQTQPHVMIDEDVGTFSIPPEIWGADWASEERQFTQERTREGKDFVSQIDMLSQMASPIPSLPVQPVNTMSIDGLTQEAHQRLPEEQENGRAERPVE
ncbi:hypothetical protein DL546_006019 [Coniochaeta pulveracea]|uniref:Uncharacterized protein n=1 Tax=Coniochaeta pulveracea TaxID=177199 RepID=A0A420Y7F6_9PEZI|nr:hypothetical protein DL546_006019 [Coniochaeta pulveracea]